MNQKPKSRIRFWGKIILLIGILSFLIGLTLLLATLSTFGFWLTVASVVINIVGVSLLTT